ncbi:ABC transporter permease [Alkalibacter saccharofermentans]|uniref:Sodium transport system permease protein n=1 Tax=Alkalibacter saccharofermentans DSM 14828 TaxID=1120975 RepID=A0A1M4SHT8_9FIRM|nr:ABC transporter permease subunit [Alkalibacter saccharofermentans]SHE31557.1 sodium transport system permease protein [Alkalibacter saccharofermentans DSM 14828]
MLEMIGVIIKKELKRVFTDKRLIFTTLILPPIMLVVLYGIIGMGASGMMEDIEAHTSRIVAVQAPEDVVGAIRATGSQVTVAARDEMEGVKENIRAGDIEVMIEFDPDFEEKVMNYTSMAAPYVNTYHNSSEDYSSSAFYMVRDILTQYENQMLGIRMGDEAYASIFELNMNNPEQVIVDEKRASGRLLSMLLPMLITIFLFAGAMSLGPDSIAGEKERGTMATLLMTPVKREVIAFGKVISLGILAFLSALSSLVGIIIALPLLAGSFAGGMGMNITDYVNYKAVDYLMILGILISMEIIFVGMISAASVVAKNVKEAGTYLMPIYFMVMIAAFSNMYSMQSPELFEYAIPVYGSIVALKSVLSFEMTALGLALNIGVSLMVGVALVYLIKVLFENENVMFNQ